MRYLFVFLFASVFLAGCGGEDEEERYEPRKSDAMQTAERYVRERIKYPSQADFSGMIGTTIKKKSPTRFYVLGYVDAQNSFGATQRIYYEGHVFYRKTEERWLVDDITLRPE